MADIFWDGFDKYAPAGSLAWYGGTTSNSDGMSNLSGEWQLVGPGPSAAGEVGFVSGRFTPSLAFQFYTLSGTANLYATRNLNQNVQTVVFGVAIKAGLTGGAGNFYLVYLLDSATIQFTIAVNLSGFIVLYRGSTTGTLLATSTVQLTPNSWYYLEGTITIHSTAGAWTINLNGATVLSATGQNTRTTANNSANQIGIGFIGSSDTNGAAFDDMYVFDTTGTVNNAMRGDSRVETLFPTVDSSVQFSPGAVALGPYQFLGQTVATAANQLYLTPVTPNQNMTINSIGFFTPTVAPSVNARGVIYADSAGHAGTLMSGGSTVVGIGGSTPTTLPLTTPQSLVVGTQYWIGYMQDTIPGTNVVTADPNLRGYTATATFTSGAPATAPAMTGSVATRVCWGNCTGAGFHSPVVSSVPPMVNNPNNPTLRGYVTDSTAGHQESYAVTDLSSTPTNIAGVKVSGFMQKMDAGARTVNLNVLSSSVSAAGSAFVPPTTPSYSSSYFDVDPATGVAWTGAGINAMQIGLVIDT